jgi:hypothetical protein
MVMSRSLGDKYGNTRELIAVMVRCVVLMRVATSLSWTLRRAGSNLFAIKVMKCGAERETQNRMVFTRARACSNFDLLTPGKPEPKTAQDL